MHPGQSIQAAIDRASPGDTIVLEPGTYRESLLIRTDGLTLRGAQPELHTSVLIPPASVPANACNQAFGPTGICVLAKRVDAHGNVITPVHDDTIMGLRVQGFYGNGVNGYGTDRMTVSDVQASHDGYYGIARFASTRTLISDNEVWGNGEAGIYVGDSPQADTVVTRNRSWDNQFGIFVRHSHGVQVSGNDSVRNCVGVMLLDDGQPGGVGNLTVTGNDVDRNNLYCPASGGGPAFSGMGIVAVGLQDSTIAGNTVNDNENTRSHLSGGIELLSAAHFTGGAAPENDTISHNTAHRNAPADLFYDRSGTDIRFIDNTCGSSIPRGLCS